MAPDNSYVNFKYPDSFIAGTKGLLRAYHVTPNQGHKASVNAAAFALDKDCFYTASSDKTIRVWNAKTGDFIRSWMPHKNAIWAMRVLGSAIVTGSGDLTIKITDSTSGRIIRTLEGHKGSVWALDVSLDGKNIASASEDTTAAIWELRSGLKLFELKGHKKAVQSVAFSLNGQLVATGSNDETLRIWCLKDGTLLKEVQAPSSVLCMAFTKDSQVLYVGLMAPHGFLAYNIENGTIHRTSSLKDHSLTVLKLISADTKLILGTENGSVILYDLGKNTIVKSCDLVNARINDIDVSSDEHSCLIGMSDGAAYLLDLNTFSGTDLTNKLQTRILGRSEYCLESFCISPDGRDIFSSSEEGVVKCWTLQSGEVFRNWRAHAHFIPDISISSSGRYLITTTEIIDRFKNIDKDEIALWDLKREGEPLRFWVENSYGTILTADFTKDEKSIIAGGNEILILDKETGQKITSINHSGSTITCLAISPDDKAVAIGSILGGISIFDIATKNLLNTIIDEETPWAIKFSSDSKLLFGGGDKRTLFIWETTSGQLKRAYEGHSEHITAIDISKDDRYVASGSDDFTLRVWDIHNNVSYGPFSHSREISEVQFIPRSYIVAASDVNGDIFLWDFLGTEKNVLTSRKLERPNVRVLFIGDKGVGKTSLINCISPTEATAEEDPLDTNSTLGCEVRIVAGDDNLFYWDFGGQRMFRVVHQFFSRGNACIAVIVFDGSRMDSIIPAIDSFRYWIEILIKNFVKKPKIIIVKNKCDQAGTFVMPIEFKNQIMSLVKKYDLKTPQEITTSAKTREGLESLIKNIKEYAADVSTFGQEIYSEMDFDAIDAQLKNYENKGELFIEFGRFFKDCQNTALNNMARKKPDVNKQKGTFTRLNPEDALSEKQIMFYLDHLEASGKLLVLAEYGAEKDYICLKPILVSKILSAVSICAFKNADLIKKSDYPEIFNQLNQDSFFRVDYGDLFRRNAEKWFTQVMNIAVDLNAIIEEIEGAQWRILNYQNQSMPLEFENLIINEKIIQVNYFKIEQIPQTILSLLTNMVINQSKLPLKADWTTEQRCVQWISGKIEHKVEWNDKDEATDILSWSTPQRKAVRVKRFTYTETTAETKEKGEKKAQERSETNINIIFESISPKGIFSPFHLIGYRIYVPLDFEYLPKSEKAFYLNEIKEIAIRFIIRLLDQVTILKWIFPALIICRNRKCRNFILDYTVTQSNLSFCNKCASKLGLIGDLWEKLPEINMEQIQEFGSRLTGTGEKQLKRKSQLLKIEERIHNNVVFQVSDSWEETTYSLILGLAPHLRKNEEINKIVQKKEEQIRPLLEIYQMKENTRKNLDILQRAANDPENSASTQLEYQVRYHEAIFDAIENLRRQIEMIQQNVNNSEDNNDFDKIDELQKSIDMLRSERRIIFSNMERNIIVMTDSVEKYLKEQKKLADTLKTALKPSDWNAIDASLQDYMNGFAKMRNFLLDAAKKLGKRAFRLFISTLTGGTISTTSETEATLVKELASTLRERAVLLYEAERENPPQKPFEAYDGPDPFIFASYAHADSKSIYAILKLLHDAGVRIWYDEGITPSKEWADIIAEKISTCTIFMVFLSKYAVGRKYVLDEISFAEKRYGRQEIQFLPIFIEDLTLPPNLDLLIGRIQAYDVYKDTKDVSLKNLLKIIEPSVKTIKHK